MEIHRPSPKLAQKTRLEQPIGQAEGSDTLSSCWSTPAPQPLCKGRLFLSSGIWSN